MISLENRKRFVELYGYLIWIRIGAVALSLLSMLPVVDGYAEMIDWLPTAALTVVLWLLGSAPGRYRKAAMLYGGSLAVVFAVYLLNQIKMADGVGWQSTEIAISLPVAASVCSFLALYQEYNAHGEAIAPIDKSVSWKWEKLFGWQIAFLLASYVLSFALIAVLFDFPAVLEGYAWAVKLVDLLISWCYIRNLKAMCSAVENME